MSDKAKTKVSIEIEFEDAEDFKQHMADIRMRVLKLLNHPSLPLDKESDTGWSKHKFDIQFPEDKTHYFKWETQY